MTKEQGEALAKSLDVDGYLECSALTQENLKPLFDRVLDEWLSNSGSNSKKSKKKGGLFGGLFGSGGGSSPKVSNEPQVKKKGFFFLILIRSFFFKKIK